MTRVRANDAGSQADSAIRKTDGVTVTAAPRKQLPATRHHHHVYVVELERDVLFERRFRDANPGYDGASPCVYVGMTGLTPARRFANHKAGVKGNRYVLKYGVRLRPDLYEFFNPMPFSAASTLEYELAEDYRALGWAVWQA